MRHSTEIRPTSLLLALVVVGSACPGGTSGINEPASPAPPAPVAAEPEPQPAPVEPAPPDVPGEPDAALSEPIDIALQRVPPAVSESYELSISADRNELTIDPPPTRRARDVRSGGFSARESERGGKIITLEGGPFRNGGWVRASFRERVTGEAQLERLKSAGYDLDVVRDLLVVDGERDPHPTLFAFSADAKKRGIVGVCSDVTILDFGSPTPTQRIAVRKPVLYLDPEEETRVRVDLEIEGDFIATHPKLHGGGWSVIASPDGRLVDEATGRTHRYLFWEGTSAGWDLDPQQAHCVPADEADAFLQSACDRFALTADECGDMITYWLPTLAKNPYNLIQFLDEAVYGRYARLDIDPEPDTLIRPFMIVRRSETPVEVGAPQLPQRRRRGFTVVEWGGADLDALLAPR